MRILLLAALTLTTLAAQSKFDYRVLATTKTSTLEKEMNEAASTGFTFAEAMGGQSAFGGKEGVVVMVRDTSESAAPKVTYRLLATSKTSTMQKELKEAGDEGFHIVGLTVAKTALGGSEVISILRKD